MSRFTARAIAARLLLLVLALLFTIDASTAAPGQDIAAARTEAIAHWRRLLTGGEHLDIGDRDIAAAIARQDAVAEHNAATLQRGADRDRLWSDIEGTDGISSTRALVRLRTMALAYATRGSKHENDAGYRDDILSAMRWLYQHRYNEHTRIAHNWWGWEIGTPQSALDILMLLGPAVPADLLADWSRAIDTFCKDPVVRTHGGYAETGANRMDKAYIAIRQGLLTGNDARIAQGRDAMSQVFEYVDSGDGFHRDGAFIQHDTLAYTGSYGRVLLSGVANAFYVLAGTPWDVIDPRRANVYHWVHDGYEPLVFRGQVFANVRGRAISRPRESDHAVGHALLPPLALLGSTAPDPRERARIASMLREWIEADTWSPFAANASAADLALVRGYIARAPRRGDLVVHKQYPGMDRMIHARRGYAFTVSARSNRIGDYESGNDENLRGWYTGEGMTLLYTGADPGQYSDGYWPSVDPYRLPGTTTATQESYPRSTTNVPGFAPSLGPDRWVGGTQIGNDLAAWGMAFTARQDLVTKQPNDLVGKKSWFIVGDVIVALGAGIRASNVAAQTTIENRLYPQGSAARDKVLIVDGRPWTRTSATTRVHWFHLAGAGGYVFDAPADVGVKLETRDGRWSAINPSSEMTSAEAPGDAVHRDFATLWIDHGLHPRDASYAYTLLPNATPEQTRTYAGGLRSGRGVQIGDNTTTVQSIRGSHGEFAANFWRCGEAQGTLRALQPASVAMLESDGRITLGISDPTQAQDRVIVELARTATAVIAKDINVEVLSLAPVRIAVDTRGLQGRTSGITMAATATHALPVTGVCAQER